MTGATDLIGHEVAGLLRRADASAQADRRSALRGLGTLADRRPPGPAEHEAIAAALVRAARDPDPSVRVQSLRGLGRLPASRAFAVAAEALADDNYAAREAAVRTLFLLDSDRAVAELVAAMREGRAPVRSAALAGLRLAPNIDTVVLDALVTGLTDSDASVQGAAMRSLTVLAARTLQVAATVTALANEGLNSDSPQRREISIERLRQLREPGHRQRCLVALSDPDLVVRRRAQRGLAYTDCL
jgi:HEAT repeat protein